MVKRREIVEYQCEICSRWWPVEEQARCCEDSPQPALQVGDVVIWKGRRDGGELQTLVYDHIAEIRPYLRSHQPGHLHTFVLTKQYALDCHELPLEKQRPGRITLASRIGSSLIHSDRLESALREADPTSENLASIIQQLRAIGVPLHARAGYLYGDMIRLIYSRTWSSSGSKEFTGKVLPTGDQLAIAAFTREPSDMECLVFVGMRNYDRSIRQVEPKPHLSGAFDFNHWHQEWAGMVRWSIPDAMQLLMYASDHEIIEHVRAYRRDIIAGKAAYSSKTLQALFPAQRNSPLASGRWPAELRDWAKAHGVTGSGETRIHRALNALYNTGEAGTPMQAEDHPILFADKTVLAVAANKGGVGKSSVAALLAQALTAAGRNVLVLDCDFYGPNQPDLFPVDNPEIRTSDGKMLPHVVDGVEVLSIGHLLGRDEALTWKGIYLEPVIHLLAANTMTNADTIVIDMPPGTGDVMQAVTTLMPHARFLLVTTAGQVAVSDLRRAVAALSARQRRRIIGIVENMAGWLNEHTNTYLWGGSPQTVPDLAAALYLRFLGALPMATPAEVLSFLQHNILSSIQHYLDDDAGQTVDPKMIVEAANSLIQQEKARPEMSGLRAMWGLDNIASFLEQPIINAGADPGDQLYRAVLRSELLRVYEAIGNTPQTRQERAPAEWWSDLIPLTEQQPESTSSGK